MVVVRQSKYKSISLTPELHQLINEFAEVKTKEIGTKISPAKAIEIKFKETV